MWLVAFRFETVTTDRNKIVTNNCLPELSLGRPRIHIRMYCISRVKQRLLLTRIVFITDLI